ncbi:glycosyltransferase family 2 protein [Salinarimonas ramus]|uniref:Glycosyltransferase 2-like domain-containing protein n=1 Tax=Salinarimonas ramus TaxID=690164 RepID=A0A917QKQ9_9HYPH|nr:glycosyltransferase [Salinarimonas ramus]GGK55278.1 hypothetical protein GCM10011322_47430 [Salinarimonas ramus]
MVADILDCQEPPPQGLTLDEDFADPGLKPCVSLIIPTKNGHDLLATCIGSITRHTRWADLEIIVIDHESDCPRTRDFLRKGAAEGTFSVVPYVGPFNFAAMCNIAAERARGAILGFVNNDVEVLRPDWIERAVAHCRRRAIGAVGAKLLYPNGTVQHFGVVAGQGGIADHAFVHEGADAAGYCGILNATTEFAAVTAATLFCRASLFAASGGFDATGLAVSFNDVDFCLRLRDAGYANICDPDIVLYHHESASRGRPTHGPDRAQQRREELLVSSRWHNVMLSDPCYSPNLNLFGAPYTGLSLPPRHRWGEGLARSRRLRQRPDGSAAW